MARKINNTILDAIQYLLDQFKENAPFDRTEPATIVKVNSATSYDIMMNNSYYSAIPYLLGDTLAVSNSVWVRIPKNNLSNIYIDRKRK